MGVRHGAVWRRGRREACRSAGVAGSGVNGRRPPKADRTLDKNHAVRDPIPGEPAACAGPGALGGRTVQPSGAGPPTPPTSARGSGSAGRASTPRSARQQTRGPPGSLGRRRSARQAAGRWGAPSGCCVVVPAGVRARLRGEAPGGQAGARGRAGRGRGRGRSHSRQLRVVALDDDARRALDRLGADASLQRGRGGGTAGKVRPDALPPSWKPTTRARAES